jgi:pimeloyl-ACP methyl ester carboxylesterase
MNPLRTSLILLAAAFVSGCAAMGAQIQSVPGARARSITIEVAGDATVVDLYSPEQTQPHAVVLLAHGFARSRSTLVVLGRELAGAGFAVVVPDLPHFADHAANARFLQALAQVIKQSVNPELGLGGQRIIFAGFSAGGGASLIAAASYGDALGWIGLDPVDASKTAAAAAPKLSAPAFVIRAPASACNAQSNFAEALGSLPQLALDRLEPQASHCDFEAPTNAVCTLVCGPASAERQSAIRAAVIAAARAIATP